MALPKGLVALGSLARDIEKGGVITRKLSSNGPKFEPANMQPGTVVVIPEDGSLTGPLVPGRDTLDILRYVICGAPVVSEAKLLEELETKVHQEPVAITDYNRFLILLRHYWTLSSGIFAYRMSILTHCQKTLRGSHRLCF